MGSIKRLGRSVRIFLLELECNWLFDQCGRYGGDLNPAFEVYLERQDELRRLRWLNDQGVDLR